MISEPPLFAGAANATEALALPAMGSPIVGASGTVAGVTLLEFDDGTLVPTAFIATTEHVTGVPFARPVTVIGDDKPALLWLPHVPV